MTSDIAGDSDEGEEAPASWLQTLPWEAILAAEPGDVLDIIFGTDEYVPTNKKKAAGSDPDRL